MTFQNGDLRRHAVAWCGPRQAVSLSNLTLQMLVEGTVTLQGRVDLEATASTGTLGINPAGASSAGGSSTGAGSAAVGDGGAGERFALKSGGASALTGTVKNPSVQLDPVQLLTDEAIRFFLGVAVGAPVP